MVEPVSIVTFVGGVVLGIAFSAIYYQIKKKKLVNELYLGIDELNSARKDLMSVKNKQLEGLNAELESMAKINKKLDAAKVVMDEQSSLMGALDQPSKNGSHSHYKNSLVDQISVLEQEKYRILKSIIIDDKVDPVVSVHNPDTNGLEQIRLSLLIERMEEAYADNGMDISSEDSIKEYQYESDKPKVAKFRVHNGGKNDGSTD